MSAAGVVVIGASLAGIRSAQALRRAGYAEPITLIGAEEHHPYDRPPLSKDFLLGKIDADALALIDPTVLATLDIELRLGTRATRLDVLGHKVEIGAERLRYYTVVIATGAAPRQLPHYPNLLGVHTLRTVADATAIRDGFARGARVAVVGGGFIGAEVACAARSLGLDVTIIDPLPSLMVRGLGPEIGSVLADRHRANGVALRLGRGVSQLIGTERVERVVLDDGSGIDADLVVVGIGAVPGIGWLADSGLELGANTGVACDAMLRAAADVYAVGDVAQWSTALGRKRAEHWTNAVDQAGVVAANIAGAPTTYDPLPYVWSDQLGQRLQVWGELDAADELVYVCGDPHAEEFVAVVGGSGRLRAVVAFGARREAMRCYRLLSAGAGWKPGVGPVERAA